MKSARVILVIDCDCGGMAHAIYRKGGDLCREGDGAPDIDLDDIKPCGNCGATYEIVAGYSGEIFIGKA